MQRQVKETFEELNPTEIIKLNNLCFEDRHVNFYIYNVDMLDEVFQDMKKSEFVQKIDDFDYTDRYFIYYNGTLVSNSDPLSLIDDIDKIVDWIIEKLNIENTLKDRMINLANNN